MGVLETVTATAQFTASLMRSPNRVRCAQCGQRRHGFRIAFGVMGQMFTVPAYRCATCIGIRSTDQPAVRSPFGEGEEPESLWDGVDLTEGQGEVTDDVMDPWDEEVSPTALLVEEPEPKADGFWDTFFAAGGEPPVRPEDTDPTAPWNLGADGE